MTLRFVPPKDEVLPRYASYGAGQMKTHTELGSAKQSLSHRCGSWGEHPWRAEGFILELVDGEWFVLFHVPEGTKTDDLPWKADVWRDRRYNYSLRTEPTYRPQEYTKSRVSRAMTREQYAEWRVAVELERRGITE